MKEKIYNFPNALTLLRMILVGVMWLFFFQHQNVIIGVVLAISLFTDFLDGFLARKLRQETKFGAKFDSLADNIQGISIIIWTPFLLKEMFFNNLAIISVAMSIAVASWLFAAIKFKRNPEFHLISNKIAMCVIGLFIVHALIFTYNQIFLYVAVVVGIATSAEEILITSTHEEIDENIKTFFQKN